MAGYPEKPRVVVIHFGRANNVYLTLTQNSTGGKKIEWAGGLNSHWRRFVNYQTLSGGKKQGVNFARVLAQIWYPVSGLSCLLLLDEPLTFLDVHFQFQFMHQLVLLLEQKDLVLVGVVHDLSLAARFADHLILLNQGTVLAQGSREFVLTKEHIKTAFQLEPHIYFEREKGFAYPVFH